MSVVVPVGTASTRPGSFGALAAVTLRQRGTLAIKKYIIIAIFILYKLLFIEK